MARVAVAIVAWNSTDFLPDLFQSLEAQTFRDFQVILVDNGSTDRVALLVQAQKMPIVMVRNARNLGQGHALNQAIRFARQGWGSESLEDRFVAVLQPGMVLTPTCLAELVAEAERKPLSGMVGGKVYRLYGERRLQEEDLSESTRSDRLESTGLAAKRSRAFFIRGAGELDRGQYDGLCDVFGFSDGAVAYRASALQEASVGDEYFDKDFFAERLDIDMAWRLQWLGFSARFAPAAISFRHAGVYREERRGWRGFLAHRRDISPKRRFYEARNAFFLLFKNESIWNAALAAPWMFFSALVWGFYFLAFEPRLFLASIASVFRLQRFWFKRRALFSHRKASHADMRRWFS